MGNVQSGSTLTRTSGALDSFVTELGGDITYEKSIGQARFLKTVKCRHRSGYLVIKIFIKHDPGISLRTYHRKQKVDREALLDIANVYNYQTFVETEKAGYLIRQWIASNLYDRISTRPFLSVIEKKWIAFQLLTALSLAHIQKTPHGDIKSTNILVTSSNWIYLTDFAPYKPTRLPLDDPSDFSFFFDTSGRRTCYVAPERFYKMDKDEKGRADEEPEMKEHVTEAMDVFSAGCVIAEMFLEGAPLFTLSQLFKYREGEYSVDGQLASIEDEGICAMIKQMISLDPTSRPTFELILSGARGEVLPESFYSFLHEYVASTTERSTLFPLSLSSFSSSHAPPTTPATAISPTNTMKGSKEPATNAGGVGEALPSDSDHRVDRIWEDYANVEPFLLPEQDVERTVMDVRVDYNTTMSSSFKLHQDIFPVSLHVPSYTPSSHPTPADDGPALILLSLILANIRNCSLPSSRLRALDVLLALSAHLTDESKLDRAVPYVVELLRDEAAVVRAGAIRTLMQISMTVTVITPSNASIFPEYIIPNVRYLVQDTEVSVRATYAQCIAPLAETALRYLEMGQALKAHGVAPGVNGDRQDYEEVHFEVSYDTSLYDLHLSIQEQLSTLLMDPSPIVKRAVLHNISALCIFLGRQKTNDVVLSHMITYLNDRDWLLRHAFFESIVDVAACAGGRSLEEYILPLMVQALSDVEESVIARVLSALTSLCELGLFQKMRIWELMSATLCFFYHPNVWIRHGAVAFIASAAKRLQPSDVWCILYPSLRHLLRCDVKEIDEQSLLVAMKPPVPRPVFDGAIQWAMKAERTMFWRGQRRSTTKVESPRESIVSMRKVGSVNVARQTKTEEDEVQLLKLQNLGMTPADEMKLLAMRDYILKLANNASSFASRLRLEPEYEKVIRTAGDVELQKLSVVPQTVFLKSRASASDLPRSSRFPSSRRSSDIVGRLSTPRMNCAINIDHGPNAAAFEELRRRLATINGSGSCLNLAAAARESAGHQHPQPPSRPGTATSAAAAAPCGTLALPNPPPSHDRPSSPTDSVVSTTNSSALRVVHRLQVGSTDGQKAAPAVGSSNTNAVGVLEAPSRLRSEGSPERSGRSSPVSMAGMIKQSHRPRVTSLNPISTYDGQEVGITNFLDNLYLDNNRELQYDFGPRVHDGPVRRRNAARQSFLPRDNSNRRVEATLIAHLQSHSDCITGLAVAPDHSFFVSSSDDGTVKIWDTARLERSVTSKPRHTFTQHHAKVKSVCIIEGVHCFASAAEDGSLHIVRVHVNQSGSLPKYAKLQAIREHRVESPGEYITCMYHYNTDAASNLVYATSHSVITTLDLRTMRVLQRLENPRQFGSITCMCLDRKRTWVLVGTSSGVLSLWDKRFGLLLKSWQVGRSGTGRMARVHQCVVHPTKGKGRWVMVAVETWKGSPEPAPSTLIEVWDIEKAVLVESFVTRTTMSAPEPILEPEEQTGLDAEQSPAAAIVALVNSRYPGGAAYANFSKRDRGPSQSIDREDSLPAPSPDVRAIVVGLDFGGHSGIYRSEIVDLSTDVPTSNRNRGFVVSGSEDRRIRLWDLSKVERTSVLLGAEPEHDRPSYSTVRSQNGSITNNVETWVQSQTSLSHNNRAPQRMSMITNNQQNLLKSHQDIITALACIDSPFRGGIASGDRAGVIKVWRVGPAE
ncbi:ARM repeat-containing protein [Gyrodon lividus]|nr:ARM repeat-containing protein [Gyrodon lividus]